MKIIIVGCGKVGTTLAEQLNNEHHDITIIDKNTAVLNAITERIDVMGVVGNGAVYKVQMEAGIQETDLLIAGIQLGGALYSGGAGAFHGH